ncbi:MAG: hypothetical protein JNL11_05105 [Bdellovibrionaceae bacterium]|nr:hypothetical protein [Pseudobdellovibrionaceae bacterium]
MPFYARSAAYRFLFLISAFLFLSLSFQNCSSGFEIEKTKNSSEDSGSSNPQDSRVPSDSNNSFVKVKTFGSGEYGTCYLSLNSEVECENGKTVLKSLGRVVDFVSNVNTTCGLNADAKLTCTETANDAIISTLTLDNVKNISSNLMNICAVTNDSKVYCYYGIKNSTFQEVPSLQGAKKINSSLCSITNSDHIRCAVFNSKTNSVESEIISNDVYTDLKSTGLTSLRVCALTQLGKLNCFEVTGNFPNSYVAVTTPQFEKPVKSFAFSYEMSWGNTLFSTCVVQIDDKILCWGYNYSYAVNPLSDVKDIDIPIEVSQQPVREILKRSNEGLGTCFVLLNGTVKCSYNSKLASAFPFLAPEFEDTIQYIPLYEGAALDSYKVKTDGAVDCKRTVRWSLNVALPRDIDPCSVDVTNGFVPFGDLRGIKKIVSGKEKNYWNCALRSDGKVSCWGRSSVANQWANYSALGTKQASPMTPLGEVKGVSNAVDLVGMYNGNCVLNRMGEVWCWGEGPWNLSANTIIGETTEPIKLTEGSGFSHIVSWSGWLLLAGIKNGEVYQVKFSTSASALDKSTTLKLAGGNNFKTLVAKKTLQGVKSFGLCGLNTLNQVLCWDFASNSGVFSGEPKLVAQNVESLYSSETHICAVTTNKKLLCFGSENLNGELATGDKKSYAVPAESPLFSNVQNVLLGRDYTCVSEGGPIVCVGIRPYWSPSVNGDFLVKYSK